MKERVLIIEDDDNLRSEISAILELEGFETLQAPTGTKGLESITAFRPDLVLCDIMMPEKDGIAVLEEIRSQRSTNLIPFIFISALAEKDHIRAGMRTGADDYLTKPFSRQELMDVVLTRLDRSMVHDNFIQCKLDELRDKVISQVPHEMLTPMNAILGFSQILMTDPDVVESDRISNLISLIYQSGNRLLDLIQRFNLYLRIVTADKNDVPIIMNDRPQAVLQETAKSIAAGYNRSKDLELFTFNARVVMPEDLMSTVFREIIDNAFKFSVPGQKVRIKTHFDRHYYNVLISDSGRGFSRDQIREIGAFQQFEREILEQRGAGLGLIIAKLILELHDGNLKIESVKGKGTRVNIKFLFAGKEKPVSELSKN